MQETADTAAREVLNDRQAADFLGVAPGTLANWRCRGTVGVPYFRIGRTVRYRRADLQRFIEANRVGGEPVR